MSWASFFHKHLSRSEPWAKTSTDDSGKLEVLDYNAAYAAKLKTELGEEVVGLKTDAEVVKLWVERYNYERETPRLEVVHGDVGPDGNINIKLEWNDAFIKMLKEFGLEAATEDDLIRLYLARVTARVDADIEAAEATADAEEQPSAANRIPTPNDVEAILDNMDPDVLKMFEKDIRRRAQKRRRG